MLDIFKPKNTFQESLLIIVLTIVIAFVFNHFSEKGIPLLKKQNHFNAISDSLLISENNRFPVYDSTVTLSVYQMKLLVEKGNALIIDARNPEAYNKAHIPTAINIPYLDVFNYFEKLNIIPRDTLIIVYCEGVNCEFSAHLATFLKDINFTRVLTFHSGIEAWQKENFPTQKN